MSPINKIRTRGLLLLFGLLLIIGCSDPHSGANFDPETGKHIGVWIVDHRSAYLSNCNACVGCHGTDLQGGISKVGCFVTDWNGIACHPNGEFKSHPDWSDPNLHGGAAKGPPGCLSGFAYCQVCHGADFGGGSALSCFDCHDAGVPHPSGGWRDTRTHANAAEGNGPVCGLCHLNDDRDGPYQPLPPGANPGCFNNTLCHGDKDDD